MTCVSASGGAIGTTTRLSVPVRMPPSPEDVGIVPNALSGFPQSGLLFHFAEEKKPSVMSVLLYFQMDPSLPLQEKSARTASTPSATTPCARTRRECACIPRRVCNTRLSLVRRKPPLGKERGSCARV